MGSCERTLKWEGRGGSMAFDERYYVGDDKGN